MSRRPIRPPLRPDPVSHADVERPCEPLAFVEVKPFRERVAMAISEARASGRRTIVLHLTGNSARVLTTAPLPDLNAPVLAQVPVDSFMGVPIHREPHGPDRLALAPDGGLPTTVEI